MTRIGGVPRKALCDSARSGGGLAKPIFTVLLLALCAGCTSWREYLHNGFKVGPNYRPPNACVAQHWIDAADIRTEENPEILRCWWTVFNDRKLNELVAYAYRQNLSLREAGFRILQARASRSIVVGEIFPQRQTASGSYTRNAAAVDPSSVPTPGRFFDNWNYGFGLAWELDFWGRFRRAIAAADANLDASVFGYDDVLVTLLGDVAANYVIVRTTQERISLLRANVELQRGILQFVENRLKAGFRQTELDLDQALSTLRQSEAAVEQLEITLRVAENNLCVLLGMPPVDLTNMLQTGPIPAPPPEVVVGIPADLLRRRPDVRRAERLAAAQAEEIGIAQAELYPAFSINGNFGYTAKNFSDLFRSTAFNGSVGPSFQWNLLNYGRILNTVRLQDARFQELVIAYQNTVLQANREVENALVEFLRAQRRSRLLDESVAAARKAVNLVVEQYKTGATDFNRYALIEQNLVTQQDLWAQARGEVAQGLIAVFRALGGGWEIRLGGVAVDGPMAITVPEAEVRPTAPEELPAPLPATKPPKPEEMGVPNTRP